MSQLLKEKRTKAELEAFLKEQNSEYLLEQYAQARCAFEEDVRKRRYSEHAENVREALKDILLQRLNVQS